MAGTLSHTTNRRSFLGNLTGAAGAAVSGLLLPQTGLGGGGQEPQASRRVGGSQRRWRTAFGLNGFQLSVEIEPPFVFNRIEHLIAIVDGADHPQVGGMFDPSHFDLMNGSTGRPHELSERLGVERVGYVHFTDTDGTLFHGTSKHLPAGDGHIDVRKALEVLWRGGAGSQRDRPGLG